MTEENSKQTNENKESQADFSMGNPNTEFKSMINKNLVTNASQAQIPEALSGNNEPAVVDTSRGADSPKEIPNDQD